MAGVRSKPQPNGKYVGWYMNLAGRQKFFTGTHVKGETLRMAKRLEDDHRQIRLGYRPVPASAEKHATRPVQETVAEYLAWGRAQGGLNGHGWGVRHVQHKEAHLKWWGEQLGLHTLADLNGVLPRVETALRELMDKGRTGKTLQNYRESLNSFCRWAVQRGYMVENPLANSTGFDITPRSRRRALTLDEIGRLLRAAPPERVLLYETAIATGFRAGELAAVKVMHLDASRRGLCLEAAFAKNRRAAFQPLAPVMLEKLKAHCAGKGGDEALLAVPSHPARELREDLLAADIPLATPEGKIDFHSLRVTFATLLFEGGADTKTAMVLMRHSTPNLTLNTYARARGNRLSEAVEKMERALNSAPDYAVFRTKRAVGAEGLEVSGVLTGTPRNTNKWRRGESSLVCLLRFARPGSGRQDRRRAIPIKFSPRAHQANDPGPVCCVAPVLSPADNGPSGVAVN